MKPETQELLMKAGLRIRALEAENREVLADCREANALIAQLEFKVRDYDAVKAEVAALKAEIAECRDDSAGLTHPVVVPIPASPAPAPETRAVNWRDPRKRIATKPPAKPKPEG